MITEVKISPIRHRRTNHKLHFRQIAPDCNHRATMTIAFIGKNCSGCAGMGLKIQPTLFSAGATI